jgi:hypothetical protein
VDNILRPNLHAAHDIFEPQPIKDASVYFLRFIMHDWPDAYAKTILKLLRASAQPSTKLLLCDVLVPYAAPSNNQFSDIPGSEVPAVPYPLLANLGTASNMAVMLDLQVFVVSFNKALDGHCGKQLTWSTYFLR